LVCGKITPQKRRIGCNRPSTLANKGANWAKAQVHPCPDSPAWALNENLNEKYRGKKMKKILLTSAFVALSAGVASAQITLGGSARFGGLYTGSVDARAAVPATPDTPAIAAVAAANSMFELTNRFTLNIDGVAETDSGTTFFARVRIRGGNTGEGATAASGVSAPRVGASFGGFTVATGNILGALESTPGLYDGSVGLTGLSWGNVVTNYAAPGSFSWDSFSSAGGGANGVEVIYTANGFSGSLSYSPTGSERTAGYIAYTFGDWTAALGAQSSTALGEDMVVGTISGNLGDFGVGAAYASLDGSFNTGRINASYSFGNGTTVVGYIVDTQEANTSTGGGIGFTQSLGGATLAGGVVQDVYGTSRADIGVRFSF
jgi:outer membrane protein OmpU